MAVRVYQQTIVTFRERRYEAEVGLISSGEDHGGALAVELGHPPLQKRMVAIGSVGNAGAGGAGTGVMDRFHARLDAARLECQAEVVVGSEEQAGPTLQHGFRGREYFLETH